MKFDELELKYKQQVIMKMKEAGNIHMLKHTTEVRITEEGQVAILLPKPLILSETPGITS
jgi:hypothetical protein